MNDSDVINILICSALRQVAEEFKFSDPEITTDMAITEALLNVAEQLEDESSQVFQ